MGYDKLRKGRWSEPGRVYHVVTRVEKGRPLFLDFNLAQQCCKVLHTAVQSDRGKLLCWLLMPDHLHLLVKLNDATTLGNCVKTIKGRSAIALNRLRKTHGTVWQKSFYDRALRKDDDVLTVARYIVANPIRAGIVKRVGDYPFWNAVWVE